MQRQIHIQIPKGRQIAKEFEETGLIEIGSENILDLGCDTLPFAENPIKANFPNCCGHHNDMKKNLDSWYEKFPHCCSDHKKLELLPWFKKELYAHIPKKVLLQVAYTENFITENLDKDDWYKEITDYIDYNLDSFGTPNVGSERYYGNIKNYIEFAEVEKFDFPQWKRKQLLEFLKNKNNPPKKTNVGLGTLQTTFQKWLKTMPDLPHFAVIKNNLTNKVPINLLLTEPEYNRFSQLTLYKLRTQSELVELLVKSTRIMLAVIDTPKLFEDNSITDHEKYQIDLVNENHRVKQNQLLIEYSKDENQYVKIIKKWLENEKAYFKEITPLLKLKSMPKLFEVTIKTSFEKEYLKVFLRSQDNLEEVSKLLETLESVRRANITNNTKKDLTVYPAQTYSAEETKQHIEVVLESFLGKGKLDPIFRDQLLSNKAYEEIIENIYTFGQNLEKYQSLFDKFDEEGFRDYFLPYLNSISKSHTATGETFNKNGRTDILIQDTAGAVVFIAECKIWNGETELLKAINQLFERYVNWRDGKVSLIIFNKNAKNFGSILTKAVDSLKTHSLFVQFIGKSKESSFKFIFKHPDDSERKIELELIIFNCYINPNN